MTMIAAPTRLVQFDVEQYHLMIQCGAIHESAKTELIDGFLVRKDRSHVGEDEMSIGDDHVWCVETLRDLKIRFAPLGAHVRSQQPIVIPPRNEPEPDAMVVRGMLNDFRGRSVSAADVLCAVEVADSSLRYDRTTKLRIYATAGIEHYVIVNLVDRQVESFHRPDVAQGSYSDREIYGEADSVTFDVDGRTLTVAVAELLP